MVVLGQPATGGRLSPEELLPWLLTAGLTARDMEPVVQEVCETLTASGLPLARMNVSLSVVDPMAQARAWTWDQRTGLRLDVIAHERGPAAFASSPFAHLIEIGETEAYWLLSESEGRRFAVFNDVRAAGGGDYHAFLIPVENADFPALRGVAVTFATDAAERPNGTSAAERALLRAIAKPLALVAFRIALRDIMLALMDAYVGPPTSRRILKGEVRRGEGETVEAALIMADLTGFTSAAEGAGVGLIARLDEHLEAMAAPIEEAGGIVLKFLGDGLLAAFPISDERTAREACRTAFTAAEAAILRNAEVNVRRAEDKPLALHVALHRGEVFYGNVGSRTRLDFTVIGSAVNELSRIEGLCGPLGRPLLMSSQFAKELASTTLSVGVHRLRGIDRDFELFTV